MKNNKRFHCSECGGELYISNSRCRDGFTRLRRYLCGQCGHKETSIEMVVEIIVGNTDRLASVKTSLVRRMTNTELIAELNRRLNNERQTIV